MDTDSAIVNTVAIKLNDVKKYIIANVNLQMKQKAAARLYMVGAPGCGKSDIMRQICRENNWGLVVRYISNMSLEQLTGLPVKPTEGEVATWSVPELFNFKNMEFKPEEYVEGKTPTILLLDDFHLCDRMMQRYMFQLLTYMGLNGYHLPSNTAIILAGNRNNDKAGAMPIPAPVCNRMMFVEVMAEPEDWLKNFAIPNGIRSDICTFIHEKGDFFLSQRPMETTAWASPRSWTYLSYQMDAYETAHGSISFDELQVMASGLLGSETASEFIAYRELFAKWDFDEIRLQKWNDVKDRYKKEVNYNPTAAYAIINSATTWGLGKYKKAGFDPNNKDFLEAVKLVYNTFAYLLVMKCKNVNIGPLIAAGTKYIYLYQTACSDKKNIRPFIDFFLDQMQQERNVDWIFYELIAGIFKIKFEPGDEKKIAQAKEKIAQGKIDV